MATVSGLDRVACCSIKTDGEEAKMTILVAVKKDGEVYLGADRITTFGNEYVTDLVGGSKIIKLKHAYIATSGYSLLDNVIEHLYHSNHKMMENPFKNRSHVFSFFLELYNELKKSYTLIEPGKDTYASMYNVFLVVTPTSIYGVSTNLSVSQYEKYAARGAGADYAVGCLYGLYDVIEDGFELTRLALEAACNFSVYCKEPLDIIRVKAEDFGKISKDSHKVPASHLTTLSVSTGFAGLSIKPLATTDFKPSKNGSSKAHAKELRDVVIATNGNSGGAVRKPSSSSSKPSKSESKQSKPSGNPTKPSSKSSKPSGNPSKPSGKPSSKSSILTTAKKKGTPAKAQNSPRAIARRSR